MLKKATIAILVGTLISAATANALTAKQNVERETIVLNPDGTKTVKRETAKLVVPGEKIVYSIDYLNDQAVPANDIVLVMPVPTEITYLEGTAESANALTAYSADGGKTFHERESLVVQSADGSRPAKAEDITNIRWTVNQTVSPGAKGVLEFKGRLK